MDLSHEEKKVINSQNQRVKALQEGSVTTYWKGGKIDRISVNAEVHPSIYDPKAPGETECKD